MNKLRARFVNEVKSVEGLKLSVIVVAVKLPTGAVETITNKDYYSEKISYYLDAYDDQFRLKANPIIQIVGYMIVPCQANH